MTNKIIPTNSICELHFTKLNSPTIPNIQPPSLHSPPILTKTLYHITTNFPTNPPVQVYPTISTNISHSHDNHNSKLANANYKILNLINQKQFFLSTNINNLTISSLSQTDPSKTASRLKPDIAPPYIDIKTKQNKTKQIKSKQIKTKQKHKQTP